MDATFWYTLSVITLKFAVITTCFCGIMNLLFWKAERGRDWLLVSLSFGVLLISSQLSLIWELMEKALSNGH